MPNLKASVRMPLCFSLLLGFVLCLQAARAAEDDPGLLRTLQTDSANIENTYYLLTWFNNDTSPYHGVYLYGEGLLALGKDLGVELDFPTLDTIQPFGKEPLIMGPIGLYGRYEFYHFGAWNSETAGAFSLQAGAAYGFPNKTFKWIGSSWSIEALGGYRAGKVFFQGNYGFQGGIDPQVQSMLKANSAVGFNLGSDLFIQGEADVTIVTAPFANSSCALVPQIAFQPGEWLFEFGEAFNTVPMGFTEIMVARTF